MTLTDWTRSVLRRAFDEGPVRHDGRWLPDGGHESFVHSHQYEPLPVFDREQAEVDRREDKGTFRLMRKLSALESDAAVAEYMARHLAGRRDADGPAEAGGCLRVLSSTLVHRIEDDGTVVEIEIAAR